MEEDMANTNSAPNEETTAPKPIEVMDLSEEGLVDVVPQTLGRTPRKKVAVEKYSDFSFMTKTKKPKSAAKKTPKGKGSSQKAAKSSGKKRAKSEPVDPITTNSTTVTNDDGSTTTTLIVVNSILKKTIITTTVTDEDGTETVSTKEIDIAVPVKKKAKSAAGKKVKVQMTEEETAALIAQQIAIKESIPALEDQEKEERERLAGMKRLKSKLEKVIEAQSKIKFPIEDTLIAERDKKGNPPVDLPPSVQKLVNVPDALVGDLLYVWDFLTVFNKELNLKPMLVDEFVELLHYRSSPSPALVEVFVALLRRVYYDHSLCNTIASAVPSHINILSRNSEDDALNDLLDSQKLEQYRDWSYNGLKFLPKKVNRPETLVDALKFQCLLRSTLPRLPSYIELLRANDPQLDALISMENREGVNKDGHNGPNRDTLRSLTTNYTHELQVVNEALRELESKELYQLNLQYKLLLLMHLCRACYDTHHVRHLLVHNQEERQNQLSLMWKHSREESKKLKTIEPELREEAIQECRLVNEAASILKQQKDSDGPEAAAKGDTSASAKTKGSKGKTKGKPKTTASNSADDAKNPFDPTGPQLAAMIEDIRLRNSIGIDVIIKNDMGNVTEDNEEHDSNTSSITLTARGSLAELERKRKEREKSQLMKEDAIAWLHQALETERERDIKDALKYARLADLEGELDDGRSFCTALMFKVYRKRAQLEVASKEARVASEHEKALTQYFIRTEPIGYDRHHRAYWCFDGDTRIFVQTTLSPDQLPLQPVNLAHASSPANKIQDKMDCGNSDDENDNGADRLVSKDVATPLRPCKSLAINPSTPSTSSGSVMLLNGKFATTSTVLSPPATVTRSNTQLYASKPSNVHHTWRIYGSMMEIWMLVESLDERGIREKDLKSKLRAKFGMNKGGGGETYQTSGSEYIGRKIRRTFGRKVAYGTIVGWLPPEGEDEALWHVVHDDGDEEDLDLKDINLAFKKEAEAQEEQAKSMQDGAGTRKSARAEDMEDESDVEEVPEVVNEYVNNVPGGLGVNAKQIGLPGLRSEMLRYETMLLDGLKKKGSGFHREGKRQWEHAVKTADSLAELRACVMTLEEVIHDTQEEEDEIDSKDTKNKKEVMLSDGWIFDTLDSVMGTHTEDQEKSIDEDARKVLAETKLQYRELEDAANTAEHDRVVYEAELEGGASVSKSKQSALAKKVQKACDAKIEFEEFKEGLRHLQKRTRRFFAGHGASDGVVVAYLPAHLNEGVRLWHVEHDDGDTEDLDLQQVIRGQHYHASNAQEPDEDDTDAQEEEVEEADDDSGGEESVPSDSESEEEEEDEEDEDGSQAKLWPSLNVRTRWIQATNDSVTVAEVSLALLSLINSARGYGVVGEDPLAGAQGSRNSKKVAISNSSRTASGTNKRKRNGGGNSSSTQSVSKKARSSTNKKSTSKKAGGGGRDYSGRGPRSLMDRAAKRCVMSYAEE